MHIYIYIYVYIYIYRKIPLIRHGRIRRQRTNLMALYWRGGLHSGGETLQFAIC